MQPEPGPPRSRGSGPCWSPKLAGLAVALGGLLLLHRLVSLWLLGLLCTATAALGAWLFGGPLAAASGRLHLERLGAPAACARDPEAERQLEAEVERTIRLVLRDFVSSWYGAISRERVFEAELGAALRGLARELRRRMARADRRGLAQRLLTLSGCHLQAYIRARASLGAPGPAADPARLWEAYCRGSAPHPAVREPRAEVAYARGIVSRLLGLAPGPFLAGAAGHHVVVELVACNVVLPLVGKLADPDWIHLALAGVFSKAGTPPLPGEGGSKPQAEPPPAAPSLPPETELQGPPGGSGPAPAAAPTPPSCSEGQAPAEACPVVDEADELEGDAGPLLEERRAGVGTCHFLDRGIQGPLFLCEDLELESSLSDIRKETLMLMAPGSFLSDRIQDALCGLEGPRTMEAPGGEDSKGADGGEAEEGPGADVEADPGLMSTLNFCPEIQVDSADKEEEQDEGPAPSAVLMSPETPCPTQPPSLERAPPNDLGALDPSLPPVLLPASPVGPLSTAAFSFETLSSPDGPVVIQNLRITGTITAREHSGTGSHPYTLYTVKYETALEGESSSGLQQLAYHTVNRRYREFLNLQTRLEERSELRKFLKNVKGPKKLFPDLPFGNMDSDKVEARKSLLESFLKQLCAIPELANSEEVQEFLALNTDARIAFVKKPRIDKMVVSAIVDTLKTAFPRSEPQSPTEELSEAETDGKPQTEGKKAGKSKLRFTSMKVSPALNLSEAHERIFYGLPEDGMESEVLPMAGVQSFIEKQMKLLKVQPADTCGQDPEQRLRDCVDSSLPDADLSPSTPGSDTALADTALDLLLLLLMEQWQWLCTENMHKSLHFLFGSLLQRWLEVQVANLTCPQHWLQYLRLIRESIWPGGALPKSPRPARTPAQKQATEKQVLQDFMGLVPDLVVRLLGREKWELSWSLVLNSLQQPLINRHLVFCLWDIILEILGLPAAEDSAATHSSGNPKKTGVAL
ncbi:sorting nexin-19 [Sorex fumeus]|uniref:sorting nexin-19 n=1 Tax=Sorex fumeus TaxID=62283 RepID=UPI0024AE5F5C|nr:sorting nexin-19 [Sorex fumeus]